jgi:uncharacterized protein YoxC
MLDGLKKWLAEALKLPVMHRELRVMGHQVDLLTRQADGLIQKVDGLSAEVTAWETQAAAWQAVLVNQQLRFGSMIEQMDAALRHRSTSAINQEPLTTDLHQKNADAIATLTNEIEKLSAVLRERVSAVANEQTR